MSERVSEDSGAKLVIREGGLGCITCYVLRVLVRSRCSRAARGGETETGAVVCSVAQLSPLRDRGYSYATQESSSTE